MAAIQFVRDLVVYQAVPNLRRIVYEDDSTLASKALKALIEIDEEFLGSLIECVREKRA